jgi:hypothetical protein
VRCRRRRRSIGPSAPRDSELVRLWLRDGTDLLGYYSTKWRGWVDYHNPPPPIRGDIRFLGWQPVDQAEPLIRREQDHPAHLSWWNRHRRPLPAASSAHASRGVAIAWVEEG